MNHPLITSTLAIALICSATSLLPGEDAHIANMRYDVPSNSASHINVELCAKNFVNAELEQQAKHGSGFIAVYPRTTTSAYALFRYTPDEGYNGPDQVTYRVQSSDGTWTAPRTIYIQVGEYDQWPNKPAVIIICPTSELSTHSKVLRLAEDLRREGWAPRIVIENADRKNVLAYWKWLSDVAIQTPDTRGFLRLGNLPGDLLFLNLAWPGVEESWHLSRQIKPTSRMPIRMFFGQRRFFYSEVHPAWLNANHAYRTGQTRLPDRYYTGGDGEYYLPPEERQPTRPEIDALYGSHTYITNGRYAYRLGGNYKMIRHHSGGGGDYYSRHGQIFLNITQGCDQAAFKQRMAFDALHPATVLSGHSLASAILPRTNNSWFTENDCYGQLFVQQASTFDLHGDLTLRPPRYYAPPNAMPVIQMQADNDNPVAGDTVGFSATISDPDAHQSDNPQFNGEYLVEWRMDCDFATSGKTLKERTVTGVEGSDKTSFTTQKQTRTFPHSRWYEVRVDARDEWNAWTCQHVMVGVRPNLKSGLRINCGSPRASHSGQINADIVDSTGQVWLNEQEKPNVDWPVQDWKIGKSWERGSAYDEKRSYAAVAGTNDDRLYHTASFNSKWRQVNYTIPASGKLRVRLGFADLWSQGAGERVSDVSLEGVTVLDDFDVYAAVGPRKAVVKEFTVHVSDGTLNISLKPGGQSITKNTKTFVNWIEVVQEGGSGNNAPTPSNDSIEAVSGTYQLIDALANDTDPDGDALSITAVSQPAHGTVVIESGNLKYCSDAGYLGSDQFSYTVSDGKLSAQAQVQLQVLATANREPVAVSELAIIPIGKATRVDVLANDSDPDNDDLTITAVQDGAGFTIEITPDGKAIMCTPRPGWTLETNGTYTISDGRGGTATTDIVCRLYAERVIIMDCLDDYIWTVINPVEAGIEDCRSDGTQTILTMPDEDTRLVPVGTANN